MFKQNPNLYDISLLSKQLSNSPGANYDTEEISSFCESALSEEIESGVDRGRQAIGFLTTLNYLEYLSSPSSVSHDVAAMHFLMVEMVVALQKPSKILLAPFVYKGLDINYPLFKENNVSEVHVMNLPVLDYVERFWGIEVSDQDTIDMQDIQDGNFANDYNLIVTYLENFSHDDQMLNGMVDHLSSGGTLLLMATNDLGSLYVNQEAHPYYHPHQILSGREDVLTFHLPFALGYTLVIKK
jgi:hypothetical protein